MEQHLTHRDFRLIAVCFVVAAASLVTASHFFYDAFPEATIDFRITREEAGERARTFLDSRGLDVEGYRHSAIFLFDGMAKTFLERELGLEGATALIGDPVRLWRWSNRWVRELEKEEFRVQYTTAGELAGFSHLIEEEAAGASLDQAEARSLAEGFLSGTMGRDLAGLTFVEAEITERPNRSDHTFTWKLSGFEVSEATYRLTVGIQGDEVGRYSEYLKVPEAWQREYQELRSYNEATGLIAAVLMVLLWIGMLVVLTQSIRARDVRWKTVTVFTAIAFALTFLAQLNTLPLTEFNFDTTETYGSFLTSHLLSALLSALGQAVLIGFLTAGAEPIYRRSYGGQISLNQQFLPAGIRTKRFLTGTVIGLTMTALFVAYQTVFYVVADDLGAWSPAQIPYDQMVNTYIPWVVVLLIGFMPAVSEEFTSRAFSIPFLQRFLKKRWLAVVISALVWGFAHAGYPQQPFYIRGIEVGLAGIAVGYVMIRWGLLPALVWHYTIDAFYTAMILLRSSNSYFVVSAGLSVGLMLLPFAAALVLYVRHRFFVDPEPLLNRAESPPLDELQEAESGEAVQGPEVEPLSEPEPASAYTPLSGRRLLLSTAVVALAAGLFLLDYEKPLEETAFAVTAEEAEAAARSYLGGRGVDLEGYWVVVTGSSAASRNVAKYRMERSGFAAIDSLYSRHLPLNRWRVRFFRPLEKEEFHAYVDCGDGSVDSFTHLVEEEASGADLSEEEARAVAEAHLREFGVDAGEFELVESSSEKMKARRDHNFVWEALDGDPRNLDESFYRIEVDVIGDEASGFRRFVKLPEEWLREREESTTLKAAMSGLQIVVIVAVVLHLIWLLIRQMRSQALGWRQPVTLGLIAGALFLIGYLNSLPAFYAAYSTAMATSIFTIMQVVGTVLGLIAVGLGVVCYLGLADSLYPGCLERLRGPGRAGFFRDAALIALLAWVAGKVGDRLAVLVARQFPGFADPGFGLLSLTGMNDAAPAVSGLIATLTTGAVMPIAYGIVLFYALKVLKKPAYVIGAVLAWLLISEGGAFNAGEFLLGAGTSAIEIATVAAVIAFLLRGNIVAYILLGVLTATLDPGLDLVRQPASWFQVHGWIWIGIVAAAIAAFWIESRRHLSQPDR